MLSYVELEFVIVSFELMRLVGMAKGNDSEKVPVVSQREFGIMRLMRVLHATQREVWLCLKFPMDHFLNDYH